MFKIDVFLKLLIIEIQDLVFLIAVLNFYSKWSILFFDDKIDDNPRANLK